VARAQGPEEGQRPTPTFALVIMDVDAVDHALIPNVRTQHSSRQEPDGTRVWQQQELNP
jgi:hypothetical protein